MNNKGFAISGIMYSMLALFLILLLLILGNFHSRKTLFDKQKNSVKEKLEGIELNASMLDYFESATYITPSDGKYLLELWSSDSSSITGGYISAEVRLYQGIKLFIEIGSNGGATSIRTEEEKTITTILRANSASEDDYAYNQEEIDANGEIEEISLTPVENVKTSTMMDSSNVPEKKTQDGNLKGGYVRITRIGD